MTTNQKVEQHAVNLLYSNQFMIGHTASLQHAVQQINVMEIGLQRLESLFHSVDNRNGVLRGAG